MGVKGLRKEQKKYIVMLDQTKYPNTLGKLKKTEYKSRSIKEELRENLISAMKLKKRVFEGIYGYENSVIPDLERAILSKHNINLLGLRGQAKTRLARLMIGLLDEYTPYLLGTDLCEDPLNPISSEGIRIVNEEGDKAEIGWIHRSERYFEKLATPDVSVADLIGDVDPIKAANLKLSYSDERVIHFGMVPRANRSLFVINELPDLQARIQVALFNILQEGDIQIRGFKLRLPVDIQFIFTANPEDYTNRGSIVTPLKDRIGSQIITHYPEELVTALKITQQEARISVAQRNSIFLPSAAAELLEQISFEARKSEWVDAKSGVSARLSVSAMENLYSAAERRMLLNNEEKTEIRLTDFIGIIPSIIGKVELVYEGEQEGAATVAENLIGSAIKTKITDYLPALDKIKNTTVDNPYQGLMNWFSEGNKIDLLYDMSDEEFTERVAACKPLIQLVSNSRKTKKENAYFVMEMALWGMSEYAKINRDKLVDGLQFSDLFGAYMGGITN